LDPLLLILDSAQNSYDNSQTVNHPPLLAVLVSSYHLRRRATSKQTTMSFAVIIITIVVIVVSFFISQLRSMKPFRFLQSAGSNRVELSLVTTSSYMDIISHLPDDLLLRILSFNTTKDAIPTSLLSKRWRSLWTLAPGLGFEDRNHNGNYERFTKFVYKSLVSNNAPVLERFHLSLVTGYPFFCFRYCTIDSSCSYSPSA